VPTEKEESGEACLQLDCGALQRAAASITHGPAGAIHRCRYSPVSAADRRRLRRAVVAKTPVRLVLSDGELLLADVKVEEGSDDWVGIEGRILEAPMGKGTIP
jgi:hypothetical protein